MKNFEKILIFVSVIVIGWLLLEKCNDTPQPQPKDNSALFNSLKVYETELVVLKRVNDSLITDFINNKIIKDSIIYDVRKSHILIYDTLRNDNVKYYSEFQVDTIVDVYENLLLDADTLISNQDSIIVNLTVQNTTKDTIINNFKHNEKALKKEIKKQKRKTFFGSAISFAVGLVTGKVL